jgi:hypothetical protein
LSGFAVQANTDCGDGFLVKSSAPNEAHCAQQCALAPPCTGFAYDYDAKRSEFANCYTKDAPMLLALNHAGCGAACCSNSSLEMAFYALTDRAAALSTVPPPPSDELGLVQSPELSPSPLPPPDESPLPLISPPLEQTQPGQSPTPLPSLILPLLVKGFPAHADAADSTAFQHTLSLLSASAREESFVQFGKAAAISALATAAVLGCVSRVRRRRTRGAASGTGGMREWGEASLLPRMKNQRMD